eukprot:6815462-Prymnesium_polylepis.1
MRYGASLPGLRGTERARPSRRAAHAVPSPSPSDGWRRLSAQRPVGGLGARAHGMTSASRPSGGRLNSVSFR